MLNKFRLLHNFFHATGQLFLPFSLSFSVIFIFLQLISTSLQKKSADFLTYPLKIVLLNGRFCTQPDYNVSNRSA